MPIPQYEKGLDLLETPQNPFVSQESEEGTRLLRLGHARPPVRERSQSTRDTAESFCLSGIRGRYTFTAPMLPQALFPRSGWRLGQRRIDSRGHSLRV